VTPYSRRTVARSFANCSICCWETCVGLPEELQLPKEEGSRPWAAKGMLESTATISASVKTKPLPLIPFPSTAILILFMVTLPKQSRYCEWGTLAEGEMVVVRLLTLRRYFSIPR